MLIFSPSKSDFTQSSQQHRSEILPGSTCAVRPDLSAPSCFPAHPQKQAPLMQGTEIVSLAFGDQWNSPERERERERLRAVAITAGPRTGGGL